MAPADAVAAPPVLRPPQWYAHRLNRPIVYPTVALVAGGLPRRARVAMASAVGAAAMRAFPAERRVMEANLARVLPEADAASRAALARQVFRHFAVCFVDLLVANRRPRAADRLLARVEGRERLADPGGRGLVVLTAHLGNWDLAGRLLARHLARPTHVVLAPEADADVERFLRRGDGGPLRFVTRREPTDALPLLAALRRGEIVGLQGDRALGGRGDVRVPFFGAPAAFPLGPFLLARAAGATVVPAFCVLGADRRYTITIGEPIPLAGGEHEALRCWVRALEAAVRAHPEQWFNFFDVWSVSPAG